MVNHPNRKLTPAVRDMLRRIWAHQKEDARGAMRVYITGGQAPHERTLHKAMADGYVTECFIQLTRDAMPGVKLTESGIAAANT